MCGRFALTSPEQLLGAPGLDGLLDGGQLAALQLAPRYNIAPSQPVLALRNSDPPAPALLRWGLVPSWADDEKIGYRMINARAETVASKPAYRRAFRARRCLILADGFYEWQAAGKGQRKQPFFIRRADRQPFAFAGLWERWKRGADEEPLRSCTIVTCPPNAVLAPIHDRMPVILPPERYREWLDPAPRQDAALGALLVPCAPEVLEAYPVSTLVNAPAVDRPECILPAAAPAPAAGPLFD